MSYQEIPYAPYDFANRRHIGPSPAEIRAMLKVVRAESLDALVDRVVPEDIRLKEPLSWGRGLSEQAVLARLSETAAKNRPVVSLIGQGYHGTVTPPAIMRNIFENPAWYTAYTPYQPEISQGRLEALLNFQTMISDLTALDIANASLLDESSAAAEAMALCKRAGKSGKNGFFVDHHCHPQSISVVKTRARALGWKVIVGDPFADLDPPELFGALFQNPGTFGAVHDFTAPIAALHEADALAVVAADPLSLTLLKPPGEMGADIAIGSTQRFGVPMGNGGPHAAYMAVREPLKRAMPGRLVGVSVDARGNRAFRLALQTREQHIRRENATSNICTAQALLAVMAAMYGVFHGPDGLKAIAQRIHRKLVRLVRGLESLGFSVTPAQFFDTVLVEAGTRQESILAAAEEEGINLRRVGETGIGIAFDERTRRAHTQAIWRAFGGAMQDADLTHHYRLPEALLRTSGYMAHPIFHMNRAEAEMTRYMRRLADRDLALDRAMIPLGSCTMKLNPAATMMALSWPEFADVHPYAPPHQKHGYSEAIADLTEKLCQITGYDTFSMQPNAGAQGEYAGLLTIRAFHRARGEARRNVCLIPTSAHGTNPASARMAGMKAVAVRATETGDIDLEDFRAKAAAHADVLAACMITYPSTHGVFEPGVREICAITHAHGGQVYMDGANMNAMLGLARPGDIGADVGHLNLHKTFAIPHGGGGPGMGPIGVKAHLAPCLPGDPADTDSMAVASAPCGSGALLLVSWAWCLMMGGEGMTQASKVAILAANYIARSLAPFWPTLYSEKGDVAHECILDTRSAREQANVSVDDIAKRLIDCGFHAPTMSWPVAGTLMVEPTESEPKAELDRFIAAMRGIAREVDDIAAGKLDAGNNPLRRAPHTVEDLVGEWNRPYERALGCFPPGARRIDKYWAPVNRVDNAWGDRNLFCACPPLEVNGHDGET